MRHFLFFSSLVLSLAGCTTDITDSTETDNKSYNKKIVEYLQRTYDVKAEVKFAPTYMTSVNPTMVVKSKIAAYGDVDITKGTGDFLIQYAGDGTWFTFDIID